MIVSEALGAASEKLRQSGIPEFRREAASLLRLALNRDAVFLIAHPEYTLTADEVETYRRFVSRRAAREPYQYIVEHQEFFGLGFKVAAGVLIPRPETEILVERSIGLLQQIDEPRFYEIGVGTGCVSISILHNLVTARAVGVDISEIALSTASENARTHGVDSRLDLRNASVFDGADRGYDLIVSNPPYIPDARLPELQPEVGRFEPQTALFGGPDGLDIVRQIVADAPAFLNRGGSVLLEIGLGQAELVEKLFETAIWAAIEFIPDFQGISRVVQGRLRS
jgi:release factor glutamine methyltransferase